MKSRGKREAGGKSERGTDRASCAFSLPPPSAPSCTSCTARIRAPAALAALACSQDAPLAYAHRLLPQEQCRVEVLGYSRSRVVMEATPRMIWPRGVISKMFSCPGTLSSGPRPCGEGGWVGRNERGGWQGEKVLRGNLPNSLSSTDSYISVADDAHTTRQRGGPGQPPLRKRPLR
jgi:hypothetical protein